MELRHLAYFARVAELRSVTRAAAVLHMTQPALSRQIQALERHLDHQLFERTSRGVRLTSAGTGLHRHLDAVFAQLERIPEVVRTASQHQELVRIGVPQGLPDRWALAVLRAVEEVIPSVSFFLHEATTEEQRRLLQSGLIDLGLIHTDAPELATAQLLVQEMGVAVPPESPLSGLQTITLAELDHLKVMAHAVGEINAEEVRLRNASLSAGIDTDWVFRKFSEHTALIALMSKVDAVLVTPTSVHRHLPGWRWIPLEGEGAPSRRTAIRTWAAWREPARPFLLKVVKAVKDAADGTTDPDISVSKHSAVEGSE